MNFVAGQFQFSQVAAFAYQQDAHYEQDEQSEHLVHAVACQEFRDTVG